MFLNSYIVISRDDFEIMILETIAHDDFKVVAKLFSRAFPKLESEDPSGGPIMAPNPETINCINFIKIT